MALLHIKNLEMSGNSNGFGFLFENLTAIDTGIDDLVHFCNTGKYPERKNPNVYISIVDGTIKIEGDKSD
jgi:hypothetical protein